MAAARDDGATAVEYGMLCLVTAIIATSVFLLAPKLDFGLPEFAKVGLGDGGSQTPGDGGTRAVVPGSGATLATDVSALYGSEVDCDDYPAPAAGDVATCTAVGTSVTVTVTFTDDDGDFTLT